MIPAGTDILCAKRHPVGTVAADIEGAVHPRHIQFADGQSVPAGGRLVCQQCGHPWSLDASVYTPNGWIPVGPRIERVPPRGMR
jgi:hypothetical protein